jgi:hypothetical protein
VASPSLSASSRTAAASRAARNSSMLTTSASRGGAARTQRGTAAFPAPWSNRPLRITTLRSTVGSSTGAAALAAGGAGAAAVAAAKRGARLIALMALSRGPPADEVAFTALTGEVEHGGDFFQGLVGATASDSLTARWQPPVPPTNPPELRRTRGPERVPSPGTSMLAPCPATRCATARQPLVGPYHI